MTTAIELRALTKRYGAARGVEELTFDVDAGQVFGFLGPNGAGKSTTIRTLLDFQRPTSGDARVLGFDSRSDSVEIHRRVGYLPGDLRLFDRMTGADHLRWFSRARRNTDPTFAASLVERFGIEMDRRVSELSKGNRQKIGVLLAFAHQPELLVLDEPTSGLDPLVQAEFDQLLRETVAEGRTVLLSSHSLDEVQRVADRVAIIRDGRLVISDSVHNLRARAPRMVTLQLADNADPADFARLDGVTNVTRHDNAIRLEARGPIGPVLQAALDHHVTDLTVRPADLDELFLSYYDPTSPSDHGP